MKIRHFLFLLLTILAFALFASFPLSANSPSITLLDDMDGNFSPELMENMKINLGSTLSIPPKTYDLSNAIDSTVATPASGSQGNIYYSANHFESVEIHWYSSFGAFISEENGRYRIGGDVNQALNTPLYIGEDHFYFINEYGEIWESSDYDYGEEILYFFPNFELTEAEVMAMNQIGASVLGGNSGVWSWPSETSYSVEKDTGASPHLYYHTLKVNFLEDTTDIKVSLTTLPFDSDFPDYYFLPKPILIALGRVRATGSFPVPSTPSSEYTTSSSNELSSIESSSEILNSSDTSSSLDSSTFLSDSISSQNLSSTEIPTSSSNYNQWVVEFGGSPYTHSPSSNLTAANSNEIFGYVPITENSEIEYIEPPPPNYNPNWSGTRIIRPYTTWTSQENLSSFNNDFISTETTSDYTVISGESTTSNNPFSFFLIIGTSSICLLLIIYTYWRSSHS